MWSRKPSAAAAAQRTVMVMMVHLEAVAREIHLEARRGFMIEMVVLGKLVRATMVVQQPMVFMLVVAAAVLAAKVEWVVPARMGICQEKVALVSNAILRA